MTPRVSWDMFDHTDMRVEVWKDIDRDLWIESAP